MWRGWISVNHLYYIHTALPLTNIPHFHSLIHSFSMEGRLAMEEVSRCWEATEDKDQTQTGQVGERCLGKWCLQWDLKHRHELAKSSVAFEELKDAHCDCSTEQGWGKARKGQIMENIPNHLKTLGFYRRATGNDQRVSSKGMTISLATEKDHFGYSNGKSGKQWSGTEFPYRLHSYHIL